MALSVSTSGRVILIAGDTDQRVLPPIWTSVLPAEAIEPVVFPFSGECSCAEVTRLVNLAAGSGAVAVVGAGGGKASDTARAVADELNLPAILTPTLASTDSPAVPSR
jgi:glycerol dehydrogenase